MIEIIKENYVNLEVKGLKKNSIIYKNNSGYKYFVDKKGNLCRKKRNQIFNIYTLFTIALIVLAYLYYSETHACNVTLNHLPETCAMYQKGLQELQSQCGSDINCVIDTRNLTQQVINNMTINYSIIDKYKGTDGES